MVVDGVAAPLKGRSAGGDPPNLRAEGLGGLGVVLGVRGGAVSEPLNLRLLLLLLTE